MAWFAPSYDKKHCEHCGPYRQFLKPTRGLEGWQIKLCFDCRKQYNLKERLKQEKEEKEKLEGYLDELAREMLELVRQEIKTHGKIIADEPKDRNVICSTLQYSKKRYVQLYGSHYKIKEKDILRVLPEFPDLENWGKPIDMSDTPFGDPHPCDVTREIKSRGEL